MGGKKGGGARTPYEAPNRLSSAQSLRVVDAISEGVLAGFGNGDDAPLKSVFLNDTPIQNADGSYNFKGVTAYFQRGTPDQSYIPGFDTIERTTGVSTRVKKTQPVVRAVTDDQVSGLRVTVGVERNSVQQDNGDVVPTTTTVQVDLLNNDGLRAQQEVTFTEKSSGVYYQDVVFTQLPAAPFNIRVTRQTGDSSSDRVNNSTYFVSYVEVIDAKMCYPNTALAALLIDSDQFGGQMPRRNYLLKGIMVLVPTNYDPDDRTYDGIWDGSFKLAWTNNPAWIFYDLLTSDRYSTLARRISPTDVDKWALYQVARYCDEMVPDGMGGQEPRFVCNVYITDKREAGALLADLASAFAGMPIWNGNQVSALLDSNTDPVALYTNSNVVDGVFAYSSAALKTIHTAVHVRYADAREGYRSKVEYVSASPEIVERFGLNIKSVTAFGCTSRGQAARFGHWILQTELRQQSSVTFTVGREGLKHLPYDVIQVADNDYAGTSVGGRIVAADDVEVTLDRDVEDAVGGMFRYYRYAPNGSAALPVAESVAVVAQPAPNRLRLETAPEIGDLDVWGLSAQVRPRLYRAMGVKENTDEGTYTITALLHDPDKYSVVDHSAVFDTTPTTAHGQDLKPVNPTVRADGSRIVLSWDDASVSGDTVSYSIDVYHDGRLFHREPDALTPELRLENLRPGNYRAEIRARSARGTLSEPLVRSWRISYTITGVRLTPQLFAINLRWVLPDPLNTLAVTEIWYGSSNDIAQASRLTSLPVPQTEYTLTNVKLSDTFYFWLRLSDRDGFSGEWTTPVSGGCDTNPEPILAQLQGSITQSALSQSLIEQWQQNITDGVSAEASARAAAIQAETLARIADVNDARHQSATALLTQAGALGSRITATENVNAQQAQQISAVTVAQGQTAAGLEEEKAARMQGDAAEAQARQTLAGRVEAAEGSIEQNNQLRIQGDQANATAITNLGTRVGQAESGLTQLQTTVADHQQATSTAVQQVSAKLDRLKVGGRNYLLHSGTLTSLWVRVKHAQEPVQQPEPQNGVITLTGSTAHWKQVSQFSKQGSRAANDWGSDLLSELVAGETYTLSFDARAEDAGTVLRTGFREQRKAPNPTVSVADKSHSLATEWQRYNHTFEVVHSAAGVSAFDYWWLGFTLYQAGTVQIRKPKLEQGTVATDWTPAPEDGAAATAAVLANLTAHQQAQAGKDDAQTQALNAAQAQIAGNQAQITSLQSTKADQNQVSSLARQELQSEWRAYTDDAQQQSTALANQLNAAMDAKVTDLQATVASSQQAAATRMTALEATASGNQALITANTQAMADLNGKVQAMHTVQVQAVGVRKAVAGIALGADGETGDSQFLVMADKLALVTPDGGHVDTPFVVSQTPDGAKMALKGDFIATGSILGSHIKANQTLSAPNILGGNLNVGNGAFTVNPSGAVTASDLSVTGGQLNINDRFRVDREGNMTAESGTFKGTVYADKIVGGVMGFHGAWEGTQGTITVAPGQRSIILFGLQAVMVRPNYHNFQQPPVGGSVVSALTIAVDGVVVAAHMFHATRPWQPAHPNDTNPYPGQNLFQFIRNFKPFGTENIHYTYTPTLNSVALPGTYGEIFTTSPVTWVAPLGPLTASSIVTVKTYYFIHRITNASTLAWQPAMYAAALTPLT